MDTKLDTPVPSSRTRCSCLKQCPYAGPPQPTEACLDSGGEVYSHSSDGGGPLPPSLTGDGGGPPLQDPSPPPSLVDDGGGPPPQDPPQVHHHHHHHRRVMVEVTDHHRGPTGPADARSRYLSSETLMTPSSLGTIAAMFTTSCEPSTLLSRRGLRVSALG